MMNDLISRRDTLHEICRRPDVKDRRYLTQNEKALAQVVENMPPVEPEIRKGTWKSVKTVCGEFNNCSECGFHVPWYYDYYGLKNSDFIRDFHTCPHCDAIMLKYTGMDVQPAVQCKYCKHSTEWYGDKRRCFLWNEDGIDVFNDGYCNYWERKDNKQNG